MRQQPNHLVPRSLAWLGEISSRGRSGANGVAPSAVWNAGGSVMHSGRIVVDREEFEQTAAAWLNAAINRAVEARGRCSIGLAGGSTPRPVYWTLSQEPF